MSKKPNISTFMQDLSLCHLIDEENERKEREVEISQLVNRLIGQI